MSEKKDKMLIIVIFAFGLLFFSGFSEYIYYASKSVMTAYVKGFPIALFSLMILLYGLKVKNNYIKNIAIIGIFLGYLYTFYSTFPILFSEEFKESGFSIGIGFYGYILSFIVFIIALFFQEKKNLKTEDGNKVEVDSSIYVLGHLVLGYKGIPYGKLTLLKNDIDNKEIIIEYKDETNNILSKKISYSYISSINLNTSVVMKEIKPEQSASDYEEANLLLTAALFGGGLMQLAANDSLNSFISIYTKVKTKTMYNIEILFKENDETKKLLLEVNTNPFEFVEKLKKNIN